VRARCEGEGLTAEEKDARAALGPAPKRGGERQGAQPVAGAAAVLDAFARGHVADIYRRITA